MKRIACLPAAIALLVCLVVLATAPSAGAENVSYGNVTVSKDAEYLDLGEQIVQDWDAYLAFLSQMPNLKQVDMFDTVVTEKEINLLVGKFPQIKFGWTIHFAKKHYIRTDQTAFSTLHGSCPIHTSKELDVLKYCTELLALDIGHNDVTDLSFLKPLTKLRVLILACNENLRNISVLSEMKDLEYLEIFSCNIRDITPITGLPHLLDLNISYNQHINKYAGLENMTQLQRLWIPQSGVPVSGPEYKALTEALPNTTIMNKGHPTNYGWREGDHYEKIYSMFRLNEYLPFVDSWPLEE